MLLSDCLQKGRPIIADGAMGTYYSLLTDQPAARCELANLENAELVRSIHRRYLQSGACILRANSFAANRASLELPLPRVLDLVEAGFLLAAEEAGEDAVALADIGPIAGEAEEAEEEYQAIIDRLLAAGARSFLFETFAEYESVENCIRYLKQRLPEAEAMASFTLSPDGFSRVGVAAARFAEWADTTPELDVLGFNCGIGPAHLLRLASALPPCGKPLSFMPNAGYPTIENNRSIFAAAPDYFGEAMRGFLSLDAAILGGCCGTTPEHIAAMSRALSAAAPKRLHFPARRAEKTPATANPFAEKLAAGRFVTVAELSPPAGSNTAKMLAAAQTLYLAGVDALTFPDSPMARVRMEPVLAAAQARRASGAAVIPHICCRDRNVYGLQAALIGAHAEGIRTVLAVTGDPLPDAERGAVKSVFNSNSIRLTGMLRQMNETIFDGDPIISGVAFDPGSRNFPAELEKLRRKCEAGARFVMTQPVFDAAFLPRLEEARALGIPVLAGVMPLVSYRNVQYFRNEVPGVVIPEEIWRRFSPEMSREEGEETGLAEALRLATLLRPHCDGFYFCTPFNRAELVVRLLQQLAERGQLEKRGPRS